jgi:SH3-like domain-containing protein
VAQGDEVQLVERSGTYWLVLCPDGQEGWIHRMTLGDVVGAAPAPSARETWATASVEIEEVDDDVLAAFMTARGRA